MGIFCLGLVLGVRLELVVEYNCDQAICMGLLSYVIL